jgi:hypothetical protein
MADEVTYGTARAADTGDTDDLSKAELQRRMEEARESISQTVAEIKDTVVNQYQSVKETVVETLDWREQYRKRPLAWSLGAMGAGFIVGYSVVGGLLKGDSHDDDDDYDTLSPEDSASYAAPRSYAAQAITGGSYGSSAYAGGGSVEAHYDEPQRTAAARVADYGGAGAQQAEQQDEEPEGPGLIERFKGTKAYDRLQDEVSTLGDRFIEELSKTAQAVVLPALFSKVKDLFGMDLSSKSSQTTTQQSPTGNFSAGSTGGASTSSSSYETSENRPYGGGGQGGQS